ncbi:MAG: phosphatidate cytidylyltransferase [Bacteroidales bacterium]|nr:phosphatidate cytidylyltransferase [Bacteroidales bacterium]
MDLKVLATRSGSGILFLVVVVAGLLAPACFLVLGNLLIAGLSMEFYRLTVGKRFRKEAVCIILAAMLAYTLGFFMLQSGMDARWMMTAFLPVIAASIFLLFDGAAGHEFPTAVYFPLIYVLPAFLAAVLMAFPVDGAYTWKLLLGIFVIIWCNDIGAYSLGMLLGQRPNSRKLFPALSPKKSWIGVVGGTLFAFLAAWLVSITFGTSVLSWPHWLAIAGIESVFGVLGDLFESLLKRHAQVKDAGKLIPGHGGLLDRFDDMLFVFPLVAVYLALFHLL